MRTYTRKRPEYQAIEGVTELCRLCLGKNEVTVPIFGEDADQLCATLSLRIMICVGLEVTRDNYLPNAICEECYKELERYYTFRKKCEVTYQKLKAHVLAMKERQYNTLNTQTSKEKVKDQVMPVETDDEQQQLVLTFDENQQIQLVNLVNSNSIQLGNSEIVTETMQDSTSQLEVQASSSDLSLIMSTMLLELGVLRQEEDRLVLVDGDLKTVELEGADDTKIVLQLVEEDEEGKSEDNGAKEGAQFNYLNTQSTLTLLKCQIEQESDIKDKTKNGKGKKDTTCPVCNKRLASRSVLTRHARVHTGARPFACAACPRRFAQRAVLKRHELVHADKRPFACAQCPKSFTQRGALAAHARGHAPPHARPLALHQCAACDKVFLYASEQPAVSRRSAAHTPIFTKSKSTPKDWI